MGMVPKSVVFSVFHLTNRPARQAGRQACTATPVRCTLNKRPALTKGANPRLHRWRGRLTARRFPLLRLAPSGRWGASRIGEDFLGLSARDLEKACTCSCSSAPASMVLALELSALPLVLSEALAHFHLLFLSSKSFWTFRWTHSAQGPRSGSGAGCQLQLVYLLLVSLLHVARKILAPT